MESYMLPFAIRDALLCLVFLVGIGAGVFAITRSRAKVGGLVIAGFLLLGIDPVLEFIIFNFVAPNNPDDYEIFNWAYACVSGLVDMIGILLIVAALYFALQPQDGDYSNQPI